MDGLRNDIRYALRTLRQNPGFALIAMLTLALGIGANTAIFSVIDGVLLRPLPYPEPDELVRVWQVGDEGGRMNVSHPNFVDLSEQNRTFEALAEYAVGSVAVQSGDHWERVAYAVVSGAFFDVLGVAPIVGRGFLPEERQGGGSVAIVSHGFWQRVLGGTRDLSRATVTTQGATYAVVGVLPPDFDFQDGTDVFTPQPRLENVSRTAHNWRALGRLRDGVTLAQARQDLSGIAHRLKQEYGDDTWMVDAAAVPLRDDLVGDARKALLVLLASAGCLLLIACANVVNLLLSRMAARQRELAVRLALGAGRRRLVQQFLTESLVLALGGGALGVLLAVWGVPALLAIEPGRLPRLDEVGVNSAVFGFAFGLAVLTAVIMAIVAGLRSARGDLRDTLGSGQRSEGGGAAANRLRGALVVSELALTIVLLVGAGLLGRSFQRIVAVDPGFRTGDAVVLDLSLPEAETEADLVRGAGLLDDLIARLQTIPGVETVGGVDALPLSGNGSNGEFIIVNGPGDVTNFDDFRRLMSDPERTGYADYRIASPEYFHAMGIPLVRGRFFDDRDGPDAPHVAVISESLASTRWPGEDPIGKQIQFGNMHGDLRVMTIVGVVGDVRGRSLEAEPEPTFYGNARQRWQALPGPISLVLYGSTEPAPVIAAARRIAQELTPMTPVRFRTLDQVLSGSLAARRFSLLLLGIFAGVALLVAAAGLYGVISYLVTQRTREVGIRMALGAQPADVLRMVVGQGAVLAGAGIACGILASLALTRFLSGMLYGVGRADPLTFVGIALLLAGVALVASYIPARRATGVDPLLALRAE